MNTDTDTDTDTDTRTRTRTHGHPASTLSNLYKTAKNRLSMARVHDAADHFWPFR